MDREVQRLEAMRKRTVLFGVLQVVGGFILFLGLLTVASGHHRVAVFSLPVGLLVLLVACLLYRHLKDRYQMAFKQHFVQRPLKEAFDRVTFTPGKGMEESEVDAAHLLNIGNDFRSDDLITGYCQGVPFRQCDLRIRNQSGSGENSSTSTYFEGRWMVFRYPKEFRTNIQVRPVSFRSAKRITGFFAEVEHMERIHTESVEFNKHFRVYGENSPEVFYILTPHFMETLLDLSRNVQGDLLFSFHRGYLYVAWNNEQNAFEAPLWDPIHPEKVRESVEQDIQVIRFFVRELKLADN